MIDIGFENVVYNFTESANASACLAVHKLSNPRTLTDNIIFHFLTMDGTAEGQCVAT